MKRAAGSYRFVATCSSSPLHSRQSIASAFSSSSPSFLSWYPNRHEEWRNFRPYIFAATEQFTSRRFYAGGPSTKQKKEQSSRDKYKKDQSKKTQSQTQKRRREKFDQRSKSMLVEERRPEEMNFRKPEKTQPTKNRLTHDGRDYQMLRAQTAKFARVELAKLGSSTGPISPVVLFRITKALEKEGSKCGTIPLVSRVGGGTGLGQYAPLIMQLVEMKSINSALHVYDTMKNEGISPNEKVFKALIAGCVEHNLKDRVLALLQEVLAYNSTRTKRKTAPSDDGNEATEHTFAADMPAILYSVINGFGKQVYLFISLSFLSSLFSLSLFSPFSLLSISLFSSLSLSLSSLFSLSLLSSLSLFSLSLLFPLFSATYLTSVIGCPQRNGRVFRAGARVWGVSRSRLS